MTNKEDLELTNPNNIVGGREFKKLSSVLAEREEEDDATRQNGWEGWTANNLGVELCCFFRWLIWYRLDGKQESSQMSTISVQKTSYHKCSKNFISVIQFPDAKLPSGRRAFNVQILNACPSEDCPIGQIRLRCGSFHSERPINGRIFRRLSKNECLVNDGYHIATGGTVSLEYTNGRDPHPPQLSSHLTLPSPPRTRNPPPSTSAPRSHDLGFGAGKIGTVDGGRGGWHGEDGGREAAVGW
ncbi:hypothetical protein D8674_005150 [Pyrus ussuriensis x Pyrus communis]|uniref:Uncharacterized protein n=1 Tax=Pyrus ussuriensis x Pyrus communis TaxID=2448454 RepID=A0A5N5FR05_9ROSA|nr:hypothetical protein D8674_005150 [Pyrus ussuriensis x Pyrus communis]